MTDEFAADLASLASRLSLIQVASWCSVLDRAESPAPGVEADLAAAGQAASAGHLIALWRRCAPTLPGAAVALALRSAAHANEAVEARRTRLVVTGPTTTSVPVRLTSSVVAGIVRAATERLLLVSFATHGVTAVVRELRAASERGVSLDLILETTEERGGRLQGGPGSGAFEMLPNGARFWHWPARNRSHPRAALHAKALVADGRTALLTSANFTDRGFDDNLEVGVLIRDPDVADSLDRHVRSLMRPEAACLEPVDR